MKKITAIYLFTFNFGYSQTAEDFFDQGMSKSNGNSKGSIAEFTKAINKTCICRSISIGLAKLSLNDLTGH
jgi:hypothetical protein